MGWHWCGFINEIGKWLLHCFCNAVTPDIIGCCVCGKYCIINNNNNEWGTCIQVAAHGLVKYIDIHQSL